MSATAEKMPVHRDFVAEVRELMARHGIPVDHSAQLRVNNLLCNSPGFRMRAAAVLVSIAKFGESGQGASVADSDHPVNAASPIQTPDGSGQGFRAAQIGQSSDATPSGSTSGGEAIQQAPQAASQPQPPPPGPNGDGSGQSSGAANSGQRSTAAPSPRTRPVVVNKTPPTGDANQRARQVDPLRFRYIRFAMTNGKDLQFLHVRERHSYVTENTQAIRPRMIENGIFKRMNGHAANWNDDDRIGDVVPTELLEKWIKESTEEADNALK